MTERRQESLPPLKAVDLFPELSDDIDRRILHAETRIKYWVLGGIMTNLVALILLAVPMVYYLGAIQAQTSAAFSTITESSRELDKRAIWMQQREMWEREAQVWMESRGFRPLHQGYGRDDES